MLTIEVIKFEAQDVITASVAAPTAENPDCVCDQFKDLCPGGDHDGTLPAGVMWRCTEAPHKCGKP